MADEIKVRVNLDVTTSQGVTFSRSASYNADMAGTLVGFHTQLINESSEEQITTGSELVPANAGFYVVKNLGTSVNAQDSSYTGDPDYITLGKTGNHILKLLPGETAVLRSNGTALYAQAVAGDQEAADTHVEVVCLEG